MKLADINNGVLKQLVQRLEDEKLSAKTICSLVAVVKSVVASLVDPDTGEPLLKREWSARFIDAPSITNQKQPCLTREQVERCIKNTASDQERLLYCLLAGSGLRIAEALAIHVSGAPDQTTWDRESSSIVVRASIFAGREIPRVKTDAAKRTVDLDPTLNELVALFVELSGIKPGAYLFQSRSGRPMHLKTARERLAKHGIPGFHSFRRYRITRLRELGVPEDIVRYWVGHEGQSITDRYSKLSEKQEVRRDWATSTGLGFTLPDLSKLPHADKSPNPQTPTGLRYIASDDDLPAELFETPTESLMEAD